MLGEAAELRRSDVDLKRPQIRVERSMYKVAGYRHYHVHDLRHSGQLLAATNGATFADVQKRMGQSTVNAARAQLPGRQLAVQLLPPRLDVRIRRIAQLGSNPR